MRNLTFLSILFSFVESLLHAHTVIKQRDDEHLCTVSSRVNVSNFRWLQVCSYFYYIVLILSHCSSEFVEKLFIGPIQYTIILDLASFMFSRLLWFASHLPFRMRNRNNVFDWSVTIPTRTVFVRARVIEIVSQEEGILERAYFFLVDIQLRQLFNFELNA